MVLSSNLRRVIFSESGVKGVGTSETLNSAKLGSSEEISTIKYFDKNSVGNLLKNTYFLCKVDYREKLFSRFSANYAREMFNTLDKLFSNKIESLNDLKEVLVNSSINERSGRTSIRVFLNYCESEELLSDEIINKIRNKIKLNISTSVDTYVPESNDINSSLEEIRNSYGRLFTLFYTFLIESGCRPSESFHFLKNFDKSRIEVHGEIAIFRNFHIRGSKNSYYLFFRKTTYEEFLKYNKSQLISDFPKFKERIVRNKNIINLKYLRKYQFTQMVKVGIDFEIANFIQGRSSRNIGFNHYLAKKEIAIREYRKIL